MKKLMLVAAMMLVCIGVSAQSQKKQFAVGGNIGVGIYENNYSPLGFGPKFQFYFWKQWRGEASFNYWTKKDNLGYMDFNANAHYVFDVAKNVNVYPLAGITVVATHGLPEGRDNQTMAGFNIGGGAEFFLASTRQRALYSRQVSLIASNQIKKSVELRIQASQAAMFVRLFWCLLMLPHPPFARMNLKKLIL